MGPSPVFRGILSAIIVTATIGCGKQAGPVNVRVGGGPAKTARATKPRRDPVEAVKGHRFYDDQHTVGGAVARACDSPAWTGQHGEGKDIVEFQGTWKATGQKLSVQWDVSGGGQVRSRHCILGGDSFSAYDLECLLFPDVSKHTGLQELQGVWQAVELQTDGRPAPEPAKAGKLMIAGNHWTLQTGSETTKGTFKHNASATPHHIDLLAHGKRDSASVEPAIYAVESDALKVCQAPPGKERPTAFETQAGDGRTLTVYKRVPTP